MTQIRTLTRSFTGGEVTPEFWGKIDDVKYQTGLATCKNFIPVPHGPIQNRPGTKFIRESKDSSKKTRLIPFTFSPTQTFVLELGNFYMRFHTLGATLLSGSPAAWSNATTYNYGDLVTHLGVKYYCVEPLPHINVQPPNALYWYPLPTTGEYEIPTQFAEADIFDIHYVQSADVMTLVHPNYLPFELRRMSATKWVMQPISFTPSLSAPSGLAATPTGGTTNPVDFYSYAVSAVDANGREGTTSSVTLGTARNLANAGAYITVTWSAVSGASYYNVYKQTNSEPFGFIGQTTSLSFIDNNIVEDLSRPIPTQNNPFQTATYFPGAVSYFEQRRCFAGSIAQPQNVWMTKSATESDLTTSLPSRDDDAILFKVAAREASTIRHIVPLNNLILLSSSAEWRVSAANSDVLTPSSVSVRPQSYIGASNVQPVVVNNNLLFASARGGRVRELAYNWQSNGYITGDLSIRAPHLFDGYEIKDMSYSKGPVPIVWFVSDNGKLLGLTYVPEQNIGAWHQHETDGYFESVTVVSEGSEDAIYVVVKRTINGSTKRYVERFQARLFDNLRDAFFVDCGLTYDSPLTITGITKAANGVVTCNSHGLTTGDNIRIYDVEGMTEVNDQIYEVTVINANSFSIDEDTTSFTTYSSGGICRKLVTTISGLSHLDGKEVSILADGAVQERKTVSSGSITLDNEAAIVNIGLPYDSDAETLPLAFETMAFGQGREKNVNTVWLRVYRSSGIFVGPNEDSLTEAKQRTDEPYGSPPNLKTEEIRLPISPSWQESGQVLIRQSDPLPLTIVSMTLEVSIGS